MDELESEQSLQHMKHMKIRQKNLYLRTYRNVQFFVSEMLSTETSVLEEDLFS